MVTQRLLLGFDLNPWFERTEELGGLEPAPYCGAVRDPNEGKFLLAVLSCVLQRSRRQDSLVSRGVPDVLDVGVDGGKVCLPVLEWPDRQQFDLGVAAGFYGLGQEE